MGVGGEIIGNVGTKLGPELKLGGRGGERRRETRICRAGAGGEEGKKWNIGGQGRMGGRKREGGELAEKYFSTTLILQ